MTIYLDLFFPIWNQSISQFETSPLFHVWFWLLLLDLHIDFSVGRWGGRYSHLYKNFLVCCDPNSQRLWHSQWSRSRCFYGTLCSYDSTDIGSLISGSSAFSKSTWTSGSSWFTYCWSLDLENFEYYFASVWDECNCVVLWTFFGILPIL